MFAASKLRILLPAALVLTAAAVPPLLGTAQANRPRLAQVPLHDAAREAVHMEREATVTLGEMIEIQRQRRALRAADAVAGAVPIAGWEAQLGAFSQIEAAERQQARLPVLPLPVAIHRDGALFRLKSQAAKSEAAAQGFCAAASAAGIECFVRRAEGS